MILNIPPCFHKDHGQLVASSNNDVEGPSTGGGGKSEREDEDGEIVAGYEACVWQGIRSGWDMRVECNGFDSKNDKSLGGGNATGLHRE